MDGALTRLRLSGLRGSSRHLRLADDERAPLRSLRSSWLREPLPEDARPSHATHVGLGSPGEADGRSPRRGPRLALSGLASRVARRPTRRARRGPSGAARSRRRAAAGSARRALFELQRAEGAEPAAAGMAERCTAATSAQDSTSTTSDRRLPARGARQPAIRPFDAGTDENDARPRSRTRARVPVTSHVASPARSRHRADVRVGTPDRGRRRGHGAAGRVHECHFDGVHGVTVRE